MHTGPTCGSRKSKLPRTRIESRMSVEANSTTYQVKLTDRHEVAEGTIAFRFERQLILRSRRVSLWT